jgi:hypothetical protein
MAPAVIASWRDGKEADAAMGAVIFMTLWLVGATAMAVVSWFADASMMHAPGASNGGQPWQLWAFRMVSGALALSGWWQLPRQIGIAWRKRQPTCAQRQLSVTLSRQQPEWTVQLEVDAPLVLTIQVSPAGEHPAHCDVRCELVDAVTGRSIDQGRAVIAPSIPAEEIELQDTGKTSRSRRLNLRAYKASPDGIQIQVEFQAWGRLQVLAAP